MSFEVIGCYFRYDQLDIEVFESRMCFINGSCIFHTFCKCPFLFWTLYCHGDLQYKVLTNMYFDYCYTIMIIN
jgi:hypothetical protein